MFVVSNHASVCVYGAWCVICVVCGLDVWDVCWINEDVSLGVSVVPDL